MINGLPTIYEVVTGTSRKQSKERTNNSSKSNKSGLKVIFACITLVTSFIFSYYWSDTSELTAVRVLHKGLKDASTKGRGRE